MIEYFLFAVNILSAVDIYRDSKKRANGFLYPLLGLLFGIFGLVIYRFVFGGNIALAARIEPSAGKISPFYRFGLVFLMLGAIFFLGGLLMTTGEISGGATSLQSIFLMTAGVVVSLLGALFNRYGAEKTRKSG